MFILITGGNNSGKSRTAERIASHIDAKRHYAATMIPWGEEGQARKRKHIAQRAGLGFITTECPADLGAVPCERGDLVLLEDVSNLLANLTFETHDPCPARAALEQIDHLRERCATLIAVTIGGLRPDGTHDDATRDYIAALATLNARLAETADTVIEMKNGAPRLTKGEKPCGI